MSLLMFSFEIFQLLEKWFLQYTRSTISEVWERINKIKKYVKNNNVVQQDRNLGTFWRSG